MQRGVRFGNSQPTSSTSSTSQTPLAQRIVPRAELLPTPATSQRTASSVSRPKQQKKTQGAVKLPIYSYLSHCPSRRVVYARSLAEPDTGLRNMTASPVVGFDIEWRPNFVKGFPPNRVACVQLANETTATVLQISSMGALPDQLIRILQDVNIMKVGVGISDDAMKLKRDWGVTVENIVDLSTVARTLDPFWEEEDRQRAEKRRLLAEEQAKAGIVPPQPRRSKERAANHHSEEKPREPRPALVGLARLTTRYLSLELVKNKRVSTSNWESTPLTDAQLLYAANDAAVAFDIYTKISFINESVTQG